tara:strand:- start:376 stop:783 length:408 start_codon:yes stop_codon:yes gene_type:complete
MFSNLVEEFLSPTYRPHYRYRTETASSVFDVMQKIDDENNTAVTYMFLPGVTSEQVDVSVNASTYMINVTVNIEEKNSTEVAKQFYSERVQKSFRMSADYDVEQTTVNLANGVLTLTTPRVTEVSKAVKLPINTK